jgi:UDP-glucose 4-epimerase
MTIMVTGGAGYIGSHMAHLLAEGGEPIVVVDDLSTGMAWAVPTGAPLLVGDVGDATFVGKVIRQHGVREIVHFAASVVVPASMRDPLGYYRNNTMNSRTLMQVAVAEGVQRFIFSSTAAVYDSSNDPIDEDGAKLPISPYGWSKLMTEQMLRDAGAAHGLQHVILRYFNVAGGDPKLRTGQSTPEATHLIKACVQAALGLRPHVQVFGTDYPTPDGTGVRDYIHVSDLVQAHADALAYLRRDGSSATFNCGYGSGFSVLQVIDTVKQVSGVDFRVIYAPRRAGDSVQVVASPQRIRSELGWTPRYDDLTAIVRHALAWERRLAELKKAGVKNTDRSIATGV